MPFNGAGSNLSGASDVFLSSTANNELLKFNSSTNKWINGTVTKSDVGLANVDNTSDANKPVSTAMQTALNTKEPTLAASSSAVAGKIATATSAVAKAGASSTTAITPATLREAGIDLVFALCGVKPVLRWTGTAWPARSTSTAVVAGYTGPVEWDSSDDPSATAPTTSVTGDLWMRRV